MKRSILSTVIAAILASFWLIGGALWVMDYYTWWSIPLIVISIGISAVGWYIIFKYVARYFWEG